MQEVEKRFSDYPDYIAVKFACQQEKNKKIHETRKMFQIQNCQRNIRESTRNIGFTRFFCIDK